MKLQVPKRLRSVKYQHGAPLPRRLRQLALLVDKPGIAVEHLLEHLGEAGLQLLCMILALPFLLPVSIPGSSIPGGLIIALIGVGVVSGRSPWLPQRLLDHQLAGRKWANVLLRAAKLTAWLARNDKPELPPPPPSRILMLHGIALTLAALLLLSPLPLPFSNTLPGYAIFLLAAGLLRRGRLLLFAGHFMLAASITYLALIALLGKAGVMALLH